MTTALSTSSTVWEECIDREICVDIPIVGRQCARIRACVRLIDDNGTIVAEVEALGRRLRYALTDACHTVVEWSIARLRLCIQNTAGGVRLVLQGCLSVAGINQCWTLLAQDIRLFAVNDLSRESLAFFGVSEPVATGYQSLLTGGTGAIATPLLEAEIVKIVRLKDA